MAQAGCQSGETEKWLGIANEKRAKHRTHTRVNNFGRAAAGVQAAQIRRKAEITRRQDQREAQ
jgi:hypothetical protein